MQAIKAFVLLGLLFSVSAIYVYAQSNTLLRKVEIPFEFSVRNKTLPAGTYTITRMNQDKSMLLLRSEDGRKAITILTNPVRAKDLSEIRRLSFHRYGETYFLNQIWERNEIQGRQLLKSSTERSLERELAKRGQEPSTVELVVHAP